LIDRHQHIVLSDAFKALLTGRDYIEARAQRYKAEQARLAGNGVQRDSGGMVEGGDLGAIDDRSRRIGDQAADAAAAGLGERHRSRAEEKKTNRKEIPRCLDNCISATHKRLLTQSRNATFNSAGAVMQRAGDGAGVPSSKTAKYLY